jgi:hypothetical protein
MKDGAIPRALQKEVSLRRFTAALLCVLCGFVASTVLAAAQAPVQSAPTIVRHGLFALD